MSEVPEVKSLRWLAFQFPFTKEPKDETDKMCNAIHIYATAGADKIESQAKTIELMRQELEGLRRE